MLRSFWFDDRLAGAAEAVARTYAVVPAPRPTSSMTSTRERVETLFLVACCVSICDIFLSIRSYGVKMVVLLGVRLNSHVASYTNSVLNEAEDETILIRACLAVCWQVALHCWLIVERSLVGYSPMVA